MLKINTYPKALVALVLTLLIFSIILSGCKTTEKTVTKSEVNKDSLAVVEATKRLADMQKQRDFYESKLRESEYLQANFKECPPVINADSLRMALTASGCDSNDIASLRKELNRAQSKYQRLADGSVIIEGNLQSVTELNTKQQDSIREISKERTLLMDSLTKTQTEFSEYKKNQNKEVVRKPVFMWYWILFIAGLIAGAFLWDRFGVKIKAIKLFRIIFEQLLHFYKCLK